MERRDLPQQLSDELDDLVGRAEERASDGQLGEALADLDCAWQRLPQPRGQWAVQPWSIAMAGIDHALRARDVNLGRTWLARLVEATDPPEDDLTASYPPFVEGRLALLQQDESAAMSAFDESVRLAGLVNFSDEIELLSWYRERKGLGRWVIPLVDPLADTDDSPEYLPESVQKNFNPAVDEGTALADQDRHPEAIAVWTSMLIQIPQPVQVWGAAAWLYSAIGNSLFLTEDLLAAELVLIQAGNCVGGEEDAMVQLRSAQVALRLGRPREEALEQLRAALALDPEILDGEDPNLRELVS